MRQRTLFDRTFRCISAGCWMSTEGFVLREEFPKTRHHQWLAFQVDPGALPEDGSINPVRAIRDIGPALTFWEAARRIWLASPPRPSHCQAPRWRNTLG